MLFLKNAIDGFKLIIGGFVIHAVFLLVMVIALRPPKYDDNEERTTEALCVYVFLIFYHLGMGLIRFWNVFQSNRFRGNMTLWLMLTVVFIILLCQRWIYVEREALVLETKR